MKERLREDKGVEKNQAKAPSRGIDDLILGTGCGKCFASWESSVEERGKRISPVRGKSQG